MRIGIAQTKPVKGDFPANIEAHLRCIALASTVQTEALFFPELSLTGYELALANALATDQDDVRLAILQRTSDDQGVIIGAGLPTRSGADVRISMVIFEPYRPRRTYSKQHLHVDEYPYFQPGVGQVMIDSATGVIAPAICFESLLPAHAANAFHLGADVYLASVSKSEQGVAKAYGHYSTIAKQYGRPVLMCNSIGPSDNFVSGGKSAVWTGHGILAAQLSRDEEGILVFDTVTEEVDLIRISSK
ncbi:MAG: carbon-nitrogen hydrolase family protein [Flavobacteriales bacterium]|nr:carbon-nitrogen hydrolase family protein [Flavobacteriales bacterium]